MEADEGFGRGDLRAFREADPEAFLRAVAGMYNLQVNSGTAPKAALLPLVDRLVAEDINLPLVMYQHPAATQEWFEDAPDFDERVIVDTELRIDRRV